LFIFKLIWRKSIQFPQVVADLISRVKDGEPMDWRYDLGEENKNKKWTNIYITALTDYHKVINIS
jgi:hypothetical protein